MFAGGLVFAAEEPSTQKGLKEFACKDVMRLSDNQREYALALVHGYRLGKMNTTQDEIEVLAAMTDQFIDHCLDNPKDNALATFEKIGKSRRGCR
ncbi:HdeA/HdeB family chaperone [Thiocapsa bogorovii]|uniref:HdeA/HdeB family chaperone n=1 Tax=Thiocapsa bogorovii TaxID=521689 RepID=UPI002FC80A84